jgi:hypothetical protein
MILSSIESEFSRYKALADAAMAQLTDAQLIEPGPGAGNSVAVVAWHIGGNLSSRFTDFLTSDGEKPGRNREAEFASRKLTHQELLDHWEHGWSVLFGSLSGLTDEQLGSTIIIRGVELKIHDALHRSLAHASYHVGQIVYLSKALRGPHWRYLSIPPGQSEAYNRNPTGEHADAHTSRIKGPTNDRE